MKICAKEAGAVMAEWLRRWTRNPMGYSLAGSNPARSEVLLLQILLYFLSFTVKSMIASSDSQHRPQFADIRSNVFKF